MMPVRERRSFGFYFRREEKRSMQVNVFNMFRSDSRDDRRERKKMVTMKEEIYILIYLFYCYFSQMRSFQSCFIH